MPLAMQYYVGLPQDFADSHLWPAVFLWQYQLSSQTTAWFAFLGNKTTTHPLMFPLKLSWGRTVCCGTACWPAVVQSVSVLQVLGSHFFFCQAGSSGLSKILHNKKLLWVAWAFSEILFDKKVGSVMPTVSSLQYILKTGSVIPLLLAIFVLLLSLGMLICPNTHSWRLWALQEQSLAIISPFLCQPGG